MGERQLATTYRRSGARRFALLPKSGTAAIGRESCRAGVAQLQTFVVGLPLQDERKLAARHRACE